MNTAIWNEDPELLANVGVEVYHVDWPELTPRGEAGVLHSKVSTDFLCLFLK